jgi:uridine kinase
MANVKKPFLIGVSGGSCSGKTTTAHALATVLRALGYTVEVVSMDMWYADVPKGIDGDKDWDWDSIQAFNLESFYDCLKRLSRGEPVEVYEHDFITYGHKQEPTVIKSAEIYIFDGIHLFYEEKIRKLFDYKLFVDCDEFLAYGRRVQRDTLLDINRRKPLKVVAERWQRFVQTNYIKDIRPMSKHANRVVKNEGDDGIEKIPEFANIVTDITSQIPRSR